MFAATRIVQRASHYLVAMAEETAGYSKAAIQTISHAIELAPEEISLRIMRARFLVKDRQPKEAIADVEAIIALSDPYRDTQLLSDAILCRDELLERVSIKITHRKHRHTTGTRSQLVE